MGTKLPTYYYYCYCYYYYTDLAASFPGHLGTKLSTYYYYY